MPYIHLVTTLLCLSCMYWGILALSPFWYRSHCNWFVLPWPWTNIPQYGSLTCLVRWHRAGKILSLIVRGKYILLLGNWNGSFMVQWVSKISLGNLVSDNFQSKEISKLETARWAKTKAWINSNPGKLDYRQFLVNDVVNKAWTLHTYWASNILVGTNENWNVKVHWATEF